MDGKKFTLKLTLANSNSDSDECLGIEVKEAERKETVDLFNEQLLALVDTLPRALPRFKKQLLDSKLQLGSALMVSRSFVIERFAKIASEIDGSDESIQDLLLKKGKEVLKSDIINEMWSELSEKSQKAVLEYGKVLREASLKYKQLSSNLDSSSAELLAAVREMGLDSHEEKELQELWEKEVKPFIEASVTGDRSKLSEIQIEALTKAELILKDFEKQQGRAFDPMNPDDVKALKKFKKERLE